MCAQLPVDSERRMLFNARAARVRQCRSETRHRNREHAKRKFNTVAADDLARSAARPLCRLTVGSNGVEYLIFMADLKAYTPDYTQVPNTILDSLPALSEPELRVALIVCRQTFGWHRERAPLSISFLEKASGNCKPAVVAACASLVKRGFLEKEKTNQFNGSNSFKLIVCDLSTTLTGKAPDLLTTLTGACKLREQVPVNYVNTNKETVKEREKNIALRAKVFIEKFIESFHELYGDKLSFKASDLKRVASLLACGLSEDELLSIAKQAWANKDPRNSWACNRARNLTRFCENIEDIRGELAKVQPVKSSKLRDHDQF